MATKNYRERLIEEVKKYPVLYDTRHENHRDIDVRDRCWLSISERLGANSEVLKREWKILRDSMRQALRRSKEGSMTKAGMPCKKWRFENKMAFILPHMTIRRRPRPLRSIKLDESEAQSPVPDQESEVWEAPVTSDQDSLDLFFASVCESTKRLPRRLQAEVKRQVLNTLLKVEDEWESEQVDSKDDVNKVFD